MKGCKLSPLGLGLSLGVLWGLSMFAMGLAAYYYSYGRPFVEAVSTVYIGYAPSIKGSIMGGVIGFIAAFILGLLIAGLYNLFSGCGCYCCSPKDKPRKSAAKKE